MMGMARSLHAMGYNCIAFNCRGVGDSTGRATLRGAPSIHPDPTDGISGQKEVQDVLSVADWMYRELNQNIIIIGSSAGAPIAGSAVPERSYIHAFVAIGYTFGRLASLLFGSHFKGNPFFPILLRQLHLCCSNPLI